MGESGREQERVGGARGRERREEGRGGCSQWRLRWAVLG